MISADVTTVVFIYTSTHASVKVPLAFYPCSSTKAEKANGTFTDVPEWKHYN
jgi:hypothetical protein